ncbi:MAG: amidohydrolase family protein [Burkholderiaceae bacterium]
MIDAHFHMWQLARGDYGWLTPELGPIYRDVGLDDWRRARAGCGIDGGILVQAAATEAETQFLLQQAEEAPDVLGVVGWVELLASDAAERIVQLAQSPKLKGLRPMLQDIANPDWILQEALQPALDAMRSSDLTLDALVKPLQLPRIEQLALRNPGLRIVIDHAGKPDIARGQWNDWASSLERLARLPEVFCKLSGLWTEAAPGASAAMLAPYVDHVLACFCPQRTLWGSDWPVLEMASTYPRWHALAWDQVPPPDRAAVFDTVARQAYHL